MFECVINISEGRDETLLRALEQAAGPSLRDRHSDRDHHRSVFTLVHDAPTLVANVQQLIRAAVDCLDLTLHDGVHPRLGVVDVVPFVPLDTHTIDEAVQLRDDLAQWIREALGLPVFLYGPVNGHDRPLPFVRKHAFGALAPDGFPDHVPARSGAISVGARPLLLAWNIWLRGASLARTVAMASALRQPGVRTLGLAVGDATQVSCNVIDVAHVPLTALYDEVSAQLLTGESIERCELVGLAPRSALDLVDPSRWAQVDLRPEATIEARLGR